MNLVIDAITQVESTPCGFSGDRWNSRIPIVVTSRHWAPPREFSRAVFGVPGSAPADAVVRRANSSPEARAVIGAFLDQDARKYASGFWPTVEQELRLGSSSRSGLGLQEAAISTLGIEELLGRNPLELSTGETSRVVLAAYAHSPIDVLILDGLLEAVDAATRCAIWESKEVVFGTRQVVVFRRTSAGPVARVWDIDSGRIEASHAEFGDASVPATDDGALCVTTRTAKDVAVSSRPTASLRIEDLCVWRAGNRVLHEFSMSASGGDYVWLTGQNGSGKSTLMDVILGWLETKCGTIEVCGERAPLRRRNYLAYAPADADAAVTEQDVLTEVSVGKHGRETRAKTQAWLASLGIPTSVVLGRLAASISLRKTATVLAALGSGRPVCLLDEPTLMLGPDETSWLSSAVVEYVRTGGLLVCASHDIAFRTAIDQQLQHGAA